MSFVWVALFLFALTLSKGQKFVNIDESLLYQDPIYPLRGFDIKIASLKVKVGPTLREANQAGLTSAAAVCQVNFINQGITKINLDGKLSISFQEYNQIDQTSQNAYMSMIKGNLINATTKQPLNPNFNKTAVIIGSDGQGNARIDTAISGSYEVPYLSSASLAQTGPINNILYSNSAINQTFFEFRLASNTSIMDALIPFLKGMNWTLVGALYETTIFGYLTEQLTEEYQSQKSEPFFACKTFVGTTGSLDAINNNATIKSFCECLKISYNKVGVVIIFSTLDRANGFAELIEQQCNNPGFTYIATTEDFLAPNEVGSDSIALNNGFLIRAFYNWDIQTYLRTCYELIQPPDADFVQNALNSYFLEQKKCAFSFENPENLPECPENIEDRTFDCICPISETNADRTVLPELFFTVDSISALGIALSVLQNNCTYLNEMKAAYAPNLPVSDFCKLTQINPPIINYALRLVRFTGYTGDISFPPASRDRLNQDFFYYQIIGTLNNLTYFGNLTVNGSSLNYSALSFPNGIPESRIVYDNPNLSDAVVAGFFGFGVFFTAAFSIILVLLIFNYRNKVLRSRSFLVTVIMCVGLLMGALGFMLMGFGATDALCWSILLIDNIGFGFLLGGLIAKNFRIYRIFSNSQMEAIDISTKRLCLFISLLTLFFLLLTLFMLLNGYSANVRVSPDNPFYIYVSCSTDSEFWNTFYSIVSVTCRVLVVLVACWLSWLTRKVRAVYNESKELAVIAYSFLMTYILLLPIYYILNDSTDSETLKYVVRAEQLIIIELLGLFVYFIPLLQRMFTTPQQ